MAKQDDKKHPHMYDYIIVSPLKNEGLFIKETLRSVIAQTKLPLRWVIVDDGSTDESSDIVRQYTSRYSFIRLLQISNPGRRVPGAGVIRAFNVGYESVKTLAFDCLVKLDCDLRLPENYFEQLLGRFTQEKSLGIASGVYLEDVGQGWNEVQMPGYHAAGAAKMVRRECFEEIGGFMSSRGWDTVDEIKAMTRGWRTTHFRDIQIIHLKPEGSGIGTFRTNLMHGEIYYLTGGGLLFFLLKLLHRMTCRPYIVAGTALLFGYVRAMFLRKQMLVSEEEARRYKQMLRARITDRLKRSTNIRHVCIPIA